jgi:hypothetical protein
MVRMYRYGLPPHGRISNLGTAVQLTSHRIDSSGDCFSADPAVETPPSALFNCVHVTAGTRRRARSPAVTTPTNTDCSPSSACQGALHPCTDARWMDSESQRQLDNTVLGG